VSKYDVRHDVDATKAVPLFTRREVGATLQISRQSRALSLRSDTGRSIVWRV